MGYLAHLINDFKTNLNDVICCSLIGIVALLLSLFLWYCSIKYMYEDCYYRDIVFLNIIIFLMTLVSVIMIITPAVIYKTSH